MSAQQVALHWSGGKDSALALSLLLAQDDITVSCLLTTIHAERGTSTVHGLPVALLEAQARSIGIPLSTVALPGAGLDGYVETMNAAAVDLRAQGIEAFAFGDLGISGARRLKEEQFGPLGIEVLEPLDALTSAESVARFLASGFAATTIVIDADALGLEHLGVPLDQVFVDGLPHGVDPAGEGGEYHSFVHDGPIFTAPIAFVPGEPRYLEREIGTTRGPRRYRYWLATPRPPTDRTRTQRPPDVAPASGGGCVGSAG